MAQTTPKDRQELVSLILDDGIGKIANALSKAISYDRDPQLFDPDYIRSRDAEIKKLQENGEDASRLEKERDKRRGKPVYLTSYQNRIVHALSYAISREIDTNENVKEEIQQSLRNRKPISRVVNITALTSLIFNSQRKRYKDIIIKEINNLAKIKQIQILGSGDNKVKITAPLIGTWYTTEDLSPEKSNNTDFIQIIFGEAFFYQLSNRYATITPKLFRIWGKSGRGTELFSVLLSSIYSIYWHYKQSANTAEEQVKEYYRKNKISKDELKEAIAEARRNAMTYRLNISKIKQKVATNYDSNPNMKRKFWIDLHNAIKGFKELDLITDGIIQTGARGQEQVIFILSENYNITDKENTPHTLLGTDTKRKDLAEFL